ncbi:hypothetical protein SAMN04488105_104364 [Salipiger thiooxidans]|uniref:AAA ATPase domain-containing protein n=1 Tax=Salipiger thiooxidans TaxID=282683 RepID=A0A1G7DQH5_9RHOB|nr:hypothetical protein [Salipiger thiooxidans]SDE53692.1 hypothetical protein SAMN04488105_104364 [Salipiger thiooxidans]
MTEALGSVLDFDALGVAGRSLALSAAVRERFRPSSSIETWLARQGADLSDAAVSEAIEVSLTLGELAGRDAESDGGAALPLAIRREILTTAGPEGVARAFQANPPRTRVELAFAGLVAGRVPDTTGYSRGELLALSVAAQWAEGLAGAAKVDAGEIERQMAAQEFVERVGGADLPLFVGREGMLHALHEIWQLRDRPTVMVEGPGGIGKSIAVARFFQMVLQSDDAALRPDAILHLDFDLPQMQRASGVDMTIEVVRQLALRWSAGGGPDAATRISRLMRALGRSEESTRSKSHSSEFRDSRHWSSPDDILAEALWIFRDMLKRAPRIIFFADSFERAELLDEVAASNVGRVIYALRQQDVDLMVIYAARAYRLPEILAGGQRESRMSVKRFTQSEAVDYLISKARQRGVRLSRSDAARANRNIRGWPLGLRIAVSMLGTSAESFDAEAWLALIEADGKTAQATLYERLLDRIANENLRRLAKPGLLVRRISEKVITEVLAAPCDLSPDINPSQLMEQAESEGQLFFREPRDHGALWHRQDLRSIMFPILQRDVPEAVARAIHDNAVAYYAEEPGDIARGEELYHRLCRGDRPGEVAQRWTMAAGQRLVGSLDELPPEGAATVRLMLGGGRSDGAGGLEELRAVARNRLSDGVTELSDLFEAGGVPETLLSPMGDIYALKLTQEGRFDELLDVAETIDAGDNVPPEVVARIAISAAGIAEGMGELSWALEFWQRAEVGEKWLDVLERLSAQVALARVLRKQHNDGPVRLYHFRSACDLLKQAYEPNSDFGTARLEVLAELSEILGPAMSQNASSYPGVEWPLLDLFRDLYPMFPSAMESRERIEVLAGLLGVPADQVHTPSDLDGLMYKFFNSSDPAEHARAVAALRSEVDASYAAVIERARRDRDQRSRPGSIAY